MEGKRKHNVLELNLRKFLIEKCVVDQHAYDVDVTDNREVNGKILVMVLTFEWFCKLDESLL
jgi:hypothetical protein